MRRLLAALLLAACGDAPPPLPASWTLHADGIQVTVERSPLVVHVANAAGEEVLTSATGGDGYSAVAWALGTASDGKLLEPGYSQFQSSLESWHGDFEVFHAVATDTRLELGMRSGENADLTVVFEVRPSTLRVEATHDQFTPRAWATAFQARADEGFLGLGERFNKTDQRGIDVYSYAEEGGIGNGEGTIAGPGNPYPNGQSMAYYPIPFFLSTAGYGFWLDTTWRSEMNLATARPDAWRAWHIGPKLAYEVYLPIPGDERPWPYHIIDLFTARTGRPMLPPAWAFGPRRRVGPDSVQAGVPEIQAMRDLDLAITSVDDTHHFFPRGSDPAGDDALRAWTASARALGYRVDCYFNSFVSMETDIPLADFAAEGVANGYFLHDPEGGFPDVWFQTGDLIVHAYIVDFTSDSAAAWYTEQFERALDLGYSGWMYDFGEYVQPEVVASNGMSGEELHNLYPVLYGKAAHDHLEAGAHAGDWLTYMRSGYTGSAAYTPFVWSGDPAASFEDSDGLPSVVRAGLNLGVSGVPNVGSDISGFHCIRDGAAAADGELLARWIEQAALTSDMHDENACVGGDSSQKANIWSSPDGQAAWKTYARLHTRLFPYFYTLAEEASATGAPIMRHVFLEHPERADLAGVNDAYYLGPGLYVAPVVARGARQKTFDLPAGTYVSWPDGAALTGGRQVTVNAPLGTLPLYLVAGRLVPLLDPSIDTLAEPSSPDTVDIVGPDDVADVYDVVGALAPGAADAAFTVHDGTALEATLSGAFAPPALAPAVNENDLATCLGCWMSDDLPGGVTRVRISAPAGAIDAGGLTLTADGTSRRLRWDLYLVN